MSPRRRPGKPRLPPPRTRPSAPTSAKSRFLAAASHDLRQPLQTMSLLARPCWPRRSLNAGTSRLIDRLDKTVVAMSSLLDKLLDINQLEAGVVQPKFSDFAIDDLLKPLQAEFDIHAAQRGLGPARRAVRRPRAQRSASAGADPAQHALERDQIYRPRQGPARLPAARRRAAASKSGIPAPAFPKPNRARFSRSFISSTIAARKRAEGPGPWSCDRAAACRAARRSDQRPLARRPWLGVCRGGAGRPVEAPARYAARLRD